MGQWVGPEMDVVRTLFMSVMNWGSKILAGVKIFLTQKHPH
jgi:hypothetical protein